MFFSDIITLRDVSVTRDSDGYISTETNSDINVWANVKNVFRSEFYAANANKINAVIAFEVHAEDYANQKRVVYNSDLYYVIRAYQKGLGIVELNCSDKAVI